MAKRRRKPRKPEPPKRIRPVWIPPPPHPVLVNLLQQFIDRRHELGLSQLELDEIAGWTQTLASKLEIGTRRVSPTFLAYWCEALNCHLALVPGPAPTRPAQSAVLTQSPKNKPAPNTILHADPPHENAPDRACVR